MEGPRVKGAILRDEKSLKEYSEDSSGYSIKPRLIVLPLDEEDVEGVVSYSAEHFVPITPRGAASNLAGSAVGSGIIVDFALMNTIVSRKGRMVKVQPGVIYDYLNNELEKYGLLLPYSPSSGDVCTIGGNAATKASGFRGVKYGSIARYIRNVRFVNPEYGVVDTADGLPPILEDAINDLRTRLLQDRKAMAALRSRENLKTSSGYNLQAFKYEAPEEVVAHLLVGSVGTLGLFTELELELASIPKKKNTCICFFKSLREAAAVVPEIVKIGPSAVELLDSSGVEIISQISDLGASFGSGALLLVEFDDDLLKSEERVVRVLEKKAAGYFIEPGLQKQRELWDARESVLKGITLGEDEKHISFVDDLGVPVERLAEFITDLEKIFTKHKVRVIIYGHAGEGNLHLRPLIKRRNWKKNVRKLAELCFRATFKYNGTLAGEHGSGRNKSPYLLDEWGSDVYRYFLEVKRIFDPRDLLNPGIMFTQEDITKNMRY